ncbi:nitroreductase family protein [Mesorhizobium sp. M0011]|uniref:nitroreductase family protein n=1 Tax=Mesorhizobium sp. M0011 TaxID=2956839 RepID=UPI00333CB3C1
MVPIDPRPNAGAVPRGEPVSWHDPHIVEFDLRPLSLGDRSLESVLRARRSSRILSEAPIEDVAFAIRETLRAHFVGVAAKHGRKLKAVVSSGALHPVMGVLLGRDVRPIVYDDISDRFLSVGARDPQQLNAFLKNCRKVLPEANGHWIALVADIRDLSRLYSDHQSLLWRDAGAVIQAMAMVAEARDLAFCPLGILGQQVVDALLPSASGLVAVGVVAIGRRGIHQNAS